jgi:hypothetical protein
MKIADNLANKCDENLGNYPEAIDWYENKIENPETLEDSVFAIIDLEHLYLLMGNDTNLRSSSYIGKLCQYKPVSLKAFKNHRDELISLLHGQDHNQSVNPENLFITIDPKNNCINIAPNPFTDRTRIYYDVDSETNIKINIYNNLGQLVETITEIGKSMGQHFYEFDASGLEKGIYFCTIISNGKPSGSLKMIML